MTDAIVIAPPVVLLLVSGVLVALRCAGHLVAASSWAIAAPALVALGMVLGVGALMLAVWLDVRIAEGWR